MNVSWRVVKLQESYVQEMHGRYDKQFEYWCHWPPWKQLKRNRHHILEYMTKPKTKCVMDFSTCHHGTKEGFQEESHFTTWRSLTEMHYKNLGMLIRFSTRIAYAVHLCFLPMRVVISIDYDICSSFVYLMAGAWWIVHSGWLLHCHDAPQCDGLSGCGQ